MKSNWLTKTIDDACEVEYGTRVVNKRDGGSVYSVYGGGGATFHMDEFNRESRMIIARFAMSERCVRFVEGKFFLNDSGLTLSPKKEVSISEEFLNLQMLYLNDEIYSLAKGSAQKNLDVPAFRKIEISFPESISEQKRIVKKLNEIFEELEEAKRLVGQNLKNSKELFESYLDSVFVRGGADWENQRLEDVFEIGSSKRVLKSEWTKSGIPFYGGREIVRLAKFGSVVSNAYISKEKYNDYASRYDMPVKGDILVTARGTIGVGYVVKEGEKFYYKDGNIISFREKVPMNPSFILYAFKSTALIKQFSDLDGATVKHLPINKAKELVLKIPDFEAQNKIVQRLHNINNEIKSLEKKYRLKLSNLDELKKTALSKAFNGEL